MSSFGATPLNEIDHTDFRALLEVVCADELPAWLETRRWFADKGRGITTVGIEDALIERVESHWLALAVTRVAFHDGTTARYLLPLTLVESSAGYERVVASPASSISGVVVDATEAPWFAEWLIAHLGGSKRSSSEAWNFDSHRASRAEIAAAQGCPVSVVRAEQSNSSLRFGDILILKLFRRLQPGPNPDEEVLRTLASASFVRVPRYLGSVSWKSVAGETFAVAVLQEFVPNRGDGWTWMLQRLQGVATGSIDAGGDDFAAEELLGQRTGELHKALSAVQEPGFVPEQPNRTTVAADSHRTRVAIDETIGLLLERQAHLHEKIRARMPEAIEALKALSGRVDGFEAEADTVRIRVHGDYHLGQTLRTLDEDWTIIDFEGEPARSLDERRQRTSALKDVAGMLRSFAYARGAAERATPVVRYGVGRARLLEWESGARRAFIAGYRQSLNTPGVPLVPLEDDAFQRALAAWELDKALYEVAYEARNRPDWIDLPLGALIPDLFNSTGR